MQCAIEGRKLIVPEGIKTVGFQDLYHYFGNHTIEEVSLPNSLQVIEQDSFFDYPDIKTINIPVSVKEIGSQAFFGLDNLEELIIFDTISCIEKHAFCNCPKLKLIIVGSSQSIPPCWDTEFAANIGEICFVTK